MRRLKRPRGVVLLIVAVLLVGGGLTGEILYDNLREFKQTKKRRAETNQNAVENARESLLIYMLARGTRPLNILRAGGAPIPPRLLMLPCPDNLGDKNLDGSQDPTCGKTGGRKTDAVNGILNSGSRFGRLPGKTRIPNNILFGNDAAFNDGLGEDFRDAHGNRLWYAVSQNIVPSTNNKPLNLHRLDSLSDKWLSMAASKPALRVLNGKQVWDYTAVTLNARVAAVVLAPGKHESGRRAESFLTTASLNVGSINASAYFESQGGESNADVDGVFVLGKPESGFDDYLSYISLGELLNPRGAFLRGYRAYTGAGETHNAPHARAPLAEIYGALARWKNVFGFYPTPAANTAAHIESGKRHCAAFHTATAAAGDAPSGLPLLPPAAVTVNTALASGAVTVTLHAPADFLTMQAATVSLVGRTEITLNDKSKSASGAVTVARYARFAVPAGAALLVESSVLEPVSASFRIPPGVTVSLLQNAPVLLAAKTPLAPNGILQGWLPAHHRTTMTIGRDNSNLILGANAEAGFLGEVVVTSAAQTITMNSEGAFILPAGGTIKIEDNFNDLQSRFFYKSRMPASYFGENKNSILNGGSFPLSVSFNKRNFVLPLFADAKIARRVIPAPLIVYPWREKAVNTLVVTRDNAHPYPPCFDARDLPKQARTFLENQNIYYAVAPNCHYGSPARCGENGITLSVAAGANIAAAAAFTLAHNFTAVISGAQTITVTDGKPETNLTLNSKSVLEIANTVVADITTFTRIDFPKSLFEREQKVTLYEGNTITISGEKELTLAAGKEIVIPSGARITAGDRTRIENAEALLIYSPAPVFYSACLGNTPPSELNITLTSGLTSALKFVRQGGGGADLTAPCQWLDDDENADGDLLYTVRPPQTAPPSNNDFFMFFGGRVRVD
ncbi:MAG: hypothetical protein ACR2P5_04340 [Gammaproteobacteria bacterium]